MISWPHVSWLSDDVVRIDLSKSEYVGLFTNILTLQNKLSWSHDLMRVDQVTMLWELILWHWVVFSSVCVWKGENACIELIKEFLQPSKTPSSFHSWLPSFLFTYSVIQSLSVKHFAEMQSGEGEVEYFEQCAWHGVGCITCAYMHCLM